MFLKIPRPTTCPIRRLNATVSHFGSHGRPNTAARQSKKPEQDQPPLGVHVEYYTWLYRNFAGENKETFAWLAWAVPRKFSSSPIFCSRESCLKASRPRNAGNGFRLVDEKQGKKVRFIITESDEQAYVDIFGGDRIASLGGRGGSCTCAMRRIASVNNNWSAGGMGGDLAYERLNARTALSKPAGSRRDGLHFSNGPTPSHSAIWPRNIVGTIAAFRASTTGTRRASSITPTSFTTGRPSVTWWRGNH